MKNRWNKVRWVVGGILLGALGASAQSSFVANINGKVISAKEFEEIYKRNLVFFPYRKPSKKAVLDDLIKRELAVQEAKRQKLDRDPRVIEQMNNVLYQALIEKELGKDVAKINVTTREAKLHYRKNPEIRTSHIFVALPPNATNAQIQDAKKRIQEIQRKHVRPGKMTFAEIAQKHSEGVAAAAGGDIDWQSKQSLDPEYYRAALRLRKGKISGVVKSSFGFHIIQLTGIRKWEDTDKGRVKRVLFEEKRKSIFDRYMKQLRRRAKVQINTKKI